MSHVVERAHRDQAIGVLGQSPVAGLGVAPQSLDVQKRMLNVCAHRTLTVVLRFMRVSQRRISLRLLMGEVLGPRCGLFDRFFLPPIGAVAVEPRLRTVQRSGRTWLSCTFAAVVVALWMSPLLVSAPRCSFMPKYQIERYKGG